MTSIIWPKALVFGCKNIPQITEFHLKKWPNSLTFWQKIQFKPFSLTTGIKNTPQLVIFIEKDTQSTENNFLAFGWKTYPIPCFSFQHEYQQILRILCINLFWALLLTPIKLPNIIFANEMLYNTGVPLKPIKNLAKFFLNRISVLIPW